MVSIIESSIPGRKPLGRNTQWFFHSGSATVPPTSHRSLEPDLEASTTKTGERPCPQQGHNSHRAKRTPCQTSIADAGHQNNNHTPYQWDNCQHTLRKDEAGIHTKNNPHTKNTTFTQSTQGCSHIETAHQDHSRKKKKKTTVDKCFS